MYPKKAPKEGITTLSAHKSNPECEEQKVIADEFEVIVYVPSCKRFCNRAS